MLSKLKVFWNWLLLKIIGPINWVWLRAIFNKGKRWELTSEDWNVLRRALAKDHYVIVLRRDAYLTTYLIWAGSILATGRGAYWSHALLNVEEEIAPNLGEFKFIESTAEGVHYSNFLDVFSCDSVCLLRPRNFSAEDWTAAMAKAISDLGKPYDTDFDPAQEAKLSCVELVRNALQSAPDYAETFPKFEAMIQKSGRILPEMLYNSDEFERVLEIRR